MEVVIFAVRRWHKQLDILAQYVGSGITEQPFRRRTKRLDQTAVVDHHHGIGNAVENGLQMRRTRLDVLGARAREALETQQDCAAPGHSKADQGKHERIDGVWCAEWTDVGNEKQA